MGLVVLAVSQYEKAKQFYSVLMLAMGMKCVFDGPKFIYFVGAKTALGIQPCSPEYSNERFIQSRVGLHHICFRARSREDIERVETLLLEMGAHIVSHAQEGKWAPGYYYVLFEDPDGIRVEINFVPGEGVLAKNAEFVPEVDWTKELTF